MTVRSCLVFAVIAGVIGAFLGHALQHDERSIEAAPNAPAAPSAAASEERRCKAERADLTAVKAQLAICMASGAWGRSEAESSGGAEVAPPDRADSKPSNVFGPGIEVLKASDEFESSEPGTLLVRHVDGALGIYHPDEWPSDDDGVIIARKLPDGRVGWYAGPDAGPRSDPAAFQPWEPPIDRLPVMRREPDGTITLDGKPASPSVQFMFGGKVEEPAKPQH